MKRTTRRGFVTTLAVMMIALVAVALAALTTRVGTAARQATAAREQAQVEQLLLAGLEIAHQNTGDAEQDVALPAALAEGGAALKVTRRGARVEVVAKVGRTRIREVRGGTPPEK